MEAMIGLAIVATIFWAMFWIIDDGLKFGIIPISIGIALSIGLAVYILCVPIKEYDAMNVMTDHLFISDGSSQDSRSKNVVVFPHIEQVRISTFKRWGSVSSTTYYHVVESIYPMAASSNLICKDTCYSSKKRELESLCGYHKKGRK